MSKERELLRAIILKADGVEGIGLSLIIKESKELLAQPKQAPAAWLLSSKTNMYTELRKTNPEGIDMCLYTVTALYASPQTREPLNDDEIRTIVNQLPTEVDLGTGIELCRIIDKHWSR